jgi:hypothetical protein
MRAEIARVQQTAGSFGIAVNDGDRCVVIITRPLAWDSEFFGMPMARIDYVLRSGDVPAELLQRSIESALSRLQAAGIKHVSLKVDVADGDAVAAAEATGFRLMDALLTYIAHPRRAPMRRVKEVGQIRAFQPGDADQILEITGEAYQGFRGRFQADPHLPAERSGQFYVQWARQCIAGAMADRIYVAAESDGRLIGWASVKRAEPVSSVGRVEVSSGSLGACRRDRPGAYAALIATAAIDNHSAGALTEASTQNSNFAMVRVLEAVGAQYARADYTFHAYLG